jgi:hypothetical protein
MRHDNQGKRPDQLELSAKLASIAIIGILISVIIIKIFG